MATLAAASWTALQNLNLSNVCLVLNKQLQSWPDLTRLDLPGCLHTLRNYHCDQDFLDAGVPECRCLAAGNWPQLADLDLSRNSFSTAATRELVKGYSGQH